MAEAPADDVKSRLAAARDRRAAREKLFDEALELRQLAILELEDKLSTDLGKRGEDFEIVDGGPDGPIAVRLGESVLYKKWRAKVKTDKDTQEDFIAFVRPCVVYPSADKFDEIIGRRGLLLDKCAGVLAKLYGGWEDKSEGKA